MALKVIGAGLGRTGTMSLMAALEQLGFEKCHHMQYVARDKRQVDFWHDIAMGGVPDWDAVFAGFQASCDFPACVYWEELCGQYPDARVILTSRDAERWYQSTFETIYQMQFAMPGWVKLLLPRVGKMFQFIVKLVWDDFFEGKFADKDYAIRRYQQHNQHVREVVPADKLLEFFPSDGWEPLCRFLEVPVPEGPFPNLNDGARIKRAVSVLRILKWMPVALAVVVPLSLIF